MQTSNPQDKEKSIHIAFADDHKLVRKGIIKILSFWKRFDVFIEADDGAELLEKITAAKTVPDICIIDIKMQGLDGYDTVLEIKKRWPYIKVLVLTVYTHELACIKMIRNGADAFLSKATSSSELQIALDSLYTKGYYLSNFIPEIINSVKSGYPLTTELKPLELDFLKLCKTEMTYRQIAEQMHISFKTIEGYRERLFNKLKVSSRVGLVLIAIQIGLI